MYAAGTYVGAGRILLLARQGGPGSQACNVNVNNVCRCSSRRSKVHAK